MPAYLRISVRFLDGEFHGRGDDGEPEWPPSPLRLFQALTNAAARLGGNGIHAENAAALRWLEALPLPPEIRAATATPTTGYQLFVPDNVGDLVAKRWEKGQDFDGSNHPIDLSRYRTAKQVRAQRLSEEATVHYLWPLAATAAPARHLQTLLTLARSVARLGWGVDLVVADAALLEVADLAALTGHRYLPTPDGVSRLLRVPQAGTLDDLEKRHRAFCTRIQGDRFAPVPPLAVYGLVNYRLDTEPPVPPLAVFALRRLDDSGFYPFDPARRGLHVAGMLRHAANRPEFFGSLGWSEDEIRRTVLGHGEVNGRPHQPVPGPRLAFLPLPSLEARGEGRRVVGSIRRVAVTVRGALDRPRFLRFAQCLDGQELRDEKAQAPAAFLSRQSGRDHAIRAYFRAATQWATVTPVVLPGYDDPRQLRRRLRGADAQPLTAAEKSALLQKLDQRIEFLLRKAIRQAGFAAVFAQHAELEWRSTGFWPGPQPAADYAVPDQHRRYRRLHVRIKWRDAQGRPIQVPGPICLGGGKFSGLGLFAALDD